MLVRVRVCVWGGGGGGDGGGGIRALKLLVMLNWSNTILMVFFSYSYESENTRQFFLQLMLNLKSPLKALSILPASCGMMPSVSVT